MWNYPPAHILVPVDFGAASARALGVAAALADRVGARLTALHAELIDAPPYFTSEQITRLERERAAARSAAERYLAAFVREAAGVEATVRVRQETPGEAILEASREADLVVMGTHGRRGPRRWWLGSVAEQVVLASPVPVLVVREAPAAVPPALLFSRVTVAAPARVGVTSPAERYAEGLATLFGGQVTELGGTDVAAGARASGGTLLVVPRTHRPDDAWLRDIAERLLRGCAMPMLFVPV